MDRLFIMTETKVHMKMQKKHVTQLSMSLKIKTMQIEMDIFMECPFLQSAQSTLYNSFPTPRSMSPGDSRRLSMVAVFVIVII